ncbi:MAG: helix-turn-helix domain-containing protein [Thermaerobacter sp.]|jgi:hypothetical protein|nr:helix-turn-helix domain-containing protein [Thermaerobacter sp.]
MPRESPFRIDLSPEQRAVLEAGTHKYKSPYCEVIRAKIILQAAEGRSNEEIATRLDLPRQVVSKWRKRFYELGLAGLQDLPRGGRPGSFSPSGGGGDKGSGL